MKRSILLSGHIFGFLLLAASAAAETKPATRNAGNEGDARAARPAAESVRSGGAGASSARAESAEARLAAALERKVALSNDLRAQPVSGAVPDDGGAALWRWLAGAGGFALVLLGGALWVKKSREAQMLAGGGIGLSIQESVWVGKGQRLIVVNAGGQRYLIGATSGRLETLAELSPAQTAAVEEREDEGGPAMPATFKDLVSQAMTTDGTPRRKRREILDGLRVL